MHLCVAAEPVALQWFLDAEFFAIIACPGRAGWNVDFHLAWPGCGSDRRIASFDGNSVLSRRLSAQS